MDYKCHDFCDGQVLKAAQLNEMDEAIGELCDSVGDIDTALDGILAIQQTYIDGGGDV